MELVRLTTPLPAREAGFSFHDITLYFDDVPRQSATKLEELLFPERQAGYAAQNRAAKLAREVCKKKWVVAQLKLYDIPGKSSDTLARCLEMLREAVTTGKCESLPASVNEIETRLPGRYAPLEVEYRRAMASYEQAKDERDRAAFVACKTPTEEANQDLKRFLRKYFLDDRDKPAPNCISLPMALPDLNDRVSLHMAAERISGLHTASGGKEPHRTIVIGWSASAVRSKALELDTQARHAAAQATTAAFDARMTKHRDFVTAQGKKEGIAVGQYIIECETISEGWDDMGEMSLNIMFDRNGSNLHGTFDFGILTGAIRLTSKPLKARQEQILAGHDEYSDDDDTDEDTDEETSESDSVTPPPAFTGSKRKAGASSSAQPSTKKSRTAAQDPLRHNFQWRGRETGEGEIQLDYDGSNVGRFDFVDKTRTVLKGVIATPFTGPAEFKGYKISSVAGRQTEYWDDFGEDGYEEERRGRWH